MIDNQDSNKDNADCNNDNPVKDNNKPDYSNYTVIYADEKEYSLGDKVEAEDVYIPPEPGKVMFSGELNEIVSDDIIFSEENHSKLLNTTNMLLGLFGECTVDLAEQ